MNDPYSSLPDNDVVERISGFISDDWNRSDEKSATESTCLFDGKIIVRMPDLGSLGIARSIQKPKSPSFWGQAYMTALSVFRWHSYANVERHANVEKRQRFFRFLTTFGGIVLLCGIGILFIGKAKDSSAEHVDDAVEIMVNNTRAVNNTNAPVVESTVAVEKPAGRPEVEAAAPPKRSPRPAATPPTEEPSTETAAQPPAPPAPTTATANVTATPAPPAASAEEGVATANSHRSATPWDRPAADAFAVLGTAPPRSENPPPAINNIAANVSAVPPTTAPNMVARGVPVMETAPVTHAATVPMTPMTPINAASAPISPYEMPPVSPFELQMIAQSNAHHSPVAPHVQPNFHAVQPGVAIYQNTHGQALPQPQLPPPAYGQGAPVHYGVPTNHQPGQYGQQNAYAVPSGYVVPNYQTMPPSAPIPSGVSTLPFQTGQNMQPHGAPTQPPNNFYNPPTTYRRVY